MQKTTSPGGVVLAHWAQNIQPSTIQQMLSIASGPDILSFALGLPAPEFFPAQDFSRLMVQILATDPLSLQYGPPDRILKRHIVDLVAARGISCREEQIFLTAGSQQGMSLLSRLLLNIHDAVLVEEAVYSGILQAIEPLQPTLLTVPTNAETGMEIEAVEFMLAYQQRPAFLYAISDGHNPLGVSLSLEKRRRLVELARQYQVPILEDDAYGLLSYGQKALPAMRSFDDEWVFYLGSFSKILAPALRTGWLIVPEKYMLALSVLKEGSDINTASFSQRVVAAYLESGAFPAHIHFLRSQYKLRRDTMIQAIEQFFPSGTCCYTPDHGMFLWVEVPHVFDMEAVLKIALEKERIAFVPGHAFAVGESQSFKKFMRLNFSNCHPAQIVKGIARLAPLL